MELAGASISKGYWKKEPIQTIVSGDQNNIAMASGQAASKSDKTTEFSLTYKCKNTV